MGSGGGEGSVCLKLGENFHRPKRNFWAYVVGMGDDMS